MVPHILFSLSLVNVNAGSVCPQYAEIEPIPVDPNVPSAIGFTVPDGLPPINDILQAIGLPPLQNAQVIRSQTAQQSDGSDGGDSSTTSTSPEQGSKVYSLTTSDATIDATVVWTRSRLGVDADITAVVTPDVIGGALLARTWSAVLLLRHKNDYQATYAGVAFDVDDPASDPIDVNGVLGSAILEGGGTGLSMKSAVTDPETETAIAMLLYAFEMSTQPESGSPSSPIPGLICGDGDCKCGALPTDTDTIDNEDCRAANSVGSCENEQCNVHDENGNNRTRNCKWVAGNPVAALGVLLIALIGVYRRRFRVSC